MAAAASSGPQALPHIDDLLRAPLEADTLLPMGKLLERGETLKEEARVAHLGRPDIAFRAFLQTSIIAIKMVPKHREYSSLQSDRPDLKRRHAALIKWIGDHHDDFERIKADIIENNKAHGVAAKHPLGKEPRPRKDPPAVNGTKKKPPVQPKPPGLNGKAIRPVSSQGLDDLATRFTNLGGPVSSPGQDPRIRTHAIVQPRETAIGHGTGLPKMPDAIYSPARGSISEEAAALPTSMPHGLFSRTGTSTPMSTAGTAARTDYFGPKKSAFSIPDGERITASELFDLWQAGARVLLIDVRGREEYDQGHIDSQSVMCMEPLILLDAGQATEDSVLNRMVLAPHAEQDLFVKRKTFDLVVMYDQSTRKMPHYVGNKHENGALLSLKRTLTMFSEIAVRPKLLEGGLDSWVDLMGPNCLRTSRTAGGSVGHAGRSPSKSISRAPMRYIPPTNVSQSELDNWREKMKDDVVRSPAELMQRFPEISTEPQSMTSALTPSGPPLETPKPPKPSDAPPLETPLLPAPPQPAAKGSSSSLSSSPFGTVGQPPAPQGGTQQKQITGLVNPGNWCYANSTIQSLRLSPGFGKDLSSRKWEDKYKIPRIGDETGEHPRLMARIVANLFHWMSEGSFSVMKAKTLMDYSSTLTRNSPHQHFGGPEQQDSQEFMTWLMDALDQETNVRRDQTPLGDGPNPDMSTGISLLQGASLWWQNHSHTNQSIVDRYWRRLEVQTTTCSNCNHRSVMWMPSEILHVPIASQSLSTLDDCLREMGRQETLDDYQCDRCKAKHKATLRRRIARMPELVCVALARFEASAAGLKKNSKSITWDLNRISMERYFIPRDERGMSDGANVTLDEHFQGPFDYQCYAVVVHVGSGISGGHYFTYVREPGKPESNTWFCVNDDNITQTSPRPSADIFYGGSGNTTPYLAFFRRIQRGSG